MRFRLGLSFLFSFVLLSFCVVPAFAVSAVPDEVPSAKAVAIGPQYAPYIGSGWITGNAPGLGHVSVYVPISASDAWGTTSDGYLCNVSGNSVSGLMYTDSGTKYYFSCSSFSIPRYRLYDGSGYQYEDLQLVVEDTNMHVATVFPGSYTFSNSWPYIVIGLMGVILVCLMRYKH